jgi:hypothetical protein
MTPRVVIRVYFGQSGDQAASAARAAQNAEQAARSAEQARANADRIIENAIQDAERAVNATNARQAPPSPAAPADPPPPGGPIVFTSDEGRPVSIAMKDGSLVLTQEGNTQVIPFRDVIPREATQIAWAIPATLSIFLIWWPISRAVVRWLNRKHTAQYDTAALEARLRDRFETLERNLDTVAVEMERLSEGQRFTTKLRAERQAPAPGAIPVEIPAGVPRGAANDSSVGRGRA